MRALSTKLILSVFIVIFCLLQVALSAPQRRRESKQVEEKVKTMSEATKRRVLAMQAANTPKEAIAKKMSYEMGGVGAAHRVIDGINAEQARKKAASKTRR
jgi:hypothetical protein